MHSQGYKKAVLAGVVVSCEGSTGEGCISKHTYVVGMISSLGDVAMTASVLCWLLATDQPQSFAMGPLHRAAYNMTADFIKVSKQD